MRPLLRGRLDEEGVWEGTWAMHEGAFFAEAAGCAPFHYKRSRQGEVEEKDAEGAAEEQRQGPERAKDVEEKTEFFSGYFIVFGLNGAKTKYSEKDVMIKFIRDEENPDVLKVWGTGANKIGKFTLEGSYNRKTGEMNVCREYSLRQRGSVRGAQARVARELEMGFSTPRDQKNEVAALEDPPDRSVSLVLERLMKILEELMDKDRGKWFCVPVNAKALGLLDYHTIIEKPMDLGTVKTRYSEGKYASPQEMSDDIRLTFSNAIHYNPRGSEVYKKAVYLEGIFDKKYEELLKDPVASAISTPAQPAPLIKRIGKRHSTPKIVFEPEDFAQDTSPDYHDTHSNKRKRRKSSQHQQYPESAAEREIKRLRDQVKRMSQNLVRMGSNMTLFNQSTLLQQPGAALPAAALPRQVSAEDKRRLGRDIQTLPFEKITRVIEIIESCGITLPINADTGEVELDLDVLDYETIQKLRKYVSRHVSAANRS